MMIYICVYIYIYMYTNIYIYTHMILLNLWHTCAAQHVQIQAAVLDDLADCLPLGCNVAYASNPAEAQRSGFFQALGPRE